MLDRIFEIPVSGKINDPGTILEHRDLSSSEIEIPPIFERGLIINGRYRVENVVAKGGMGVVYHVTDILNPERPIALKTILRRSTPMSQQIDLFNLFKAEFRTMSDLHHPNLASVYDFDTISGTEDYFFTMEFVPGKTILEATEGADWKKIIDLLVPICRALSYVHSRGIIHFDIKPANLLVSESGIPKVLDFGIAGLKKLSGGRVVAGTVSYMAPELGMSGAIIDHRSDLYSLGILVYQLLCRSLPFEGSTFSEILAQHQMAPLIWDKSTEATLPIWLRSIVERLCAKNPADRYRTANSVIEAINRQGGFSYELETQKTRESYIFSSRFVGREIEYDAVTCFVRTRMEGKAIGTPMLLVAGQSGIGKSRLLREVRYDSQLARLPFIEGNCYEIQFSEYGAIAELLTYLLPLVEAAGRKDLIENYGAELAKIEPRLAQMYSFAPSPPLNKPEAEHLRLREQVCGFFIQVAELFPYTLYINDLQWASPGTADLISHLAWLIILRERFGKTCPIALLGSYRDDEVEGRPLEKLIAQLQKEEGYKVIELKPLPSERIKPLLCSMLGVDTLPSFFVDRVVHETAGNPYFIEEVMRSLVENGSVYIEDGSWAASTQIGNLEIPTTVSNAFLRRASLLTWEQRFLIELLAVGDRPVPREVLTRLVPFTGKDLQDALSILERKQMVRSESDGQEFHLSHDRMREAIYKTINKRTLAGLHRKFGEALEQIFSHHLTPQLGALAHHFTQAGDRAKALQYSIAAGHNARDRYANDLAIRMYEQALKFLESSDSLRREIQDNLADAYRMGGRYHDALTLLKQLLSEAATEKEKAHLHRRIGAILFDHSNISDALEEQWHALELMGECRPHSRFGMTAALLGALLEHFWHLCFFRWLHKSKNEEERTLYIEQCGTYGKMAEAYWFCDTLGLLLSLFRSMNRGEHAGDSKELCFIYCGAQSTYGMLTFYRAVKRYRQKATEMADRLHSVWHQGAVSEASGIAALFMGEWNQALENFANARAILMKCGDYLEISLIYMMGYYAFLYLGRLEEARHWAQDGISICQQTRVKGLNYFLAQHALANAYLGQHETALDEAHKSLVTAEESVSDIFSRCLTELMVAECELTSGDIDNALSHLEHVKRMREENKMFHDWFVGVYPLLVRARLEKFLQEQKEPDRTELNNLHKLVQTGAHLSRRHPNFTVPSLIAGGMLKSVRGNQNAAEYIFLKAVRIAEKQGAMLYLGQAHYEAGRAQLRAAPVNRKKAMDHLLAASNAFNRCGAVSFLEMTHQLLNRV